jgi:hypothetical protein
MAAPTPSPSPPTTTRRRRRRRLPTPPALVEKELFIEGLDPRHDGLRIAHLTDIHCGRMTPESHVRAAIELARSSKPDLVMMTGDYVCWRKSEVDVARRQLAGLEPERVFATLGNHDYYAGGDQVAAALAVNGYTVLRNQTRRIELRGAPVYVVGVDDPVTGRHDLDRAFDGAGGDGTRITLCHCPEQLDAIAERGSQLMLAGHTHGGQVNVRNLFDRLARTIGKRYFAAGIYRRERTTLHLSSGVGFSGVRVRVGPGTRSEVAVLVLKSRSERTARATT